MKETKDLADFKAIFSIELERNCRLFVPSFFKSLRQICENEEKRKVINEVLTNALESHRKSKTIFNELEGQIIEPSKSIAVLRISITSIVFCLSVLVRFST